MVNPTSRELELARSVQERTYPHKIPQVPGFEVFGRTASASFGNGDFFDTIGVKPRPGRHGFLLDDSDTVEHLVITLGDATGHGIASALIATQTRAMLRASIRLGVYHRDLVAVLNGQLSDDLADEHFITLLMGRLNREKNQFRWVSFGQSPIWLYRAATRSVESLPAHLPPLGALPDLGSYQPTETGFEPGDVLLALSDGFTETMNAAGVLLGEDAVRETFASHAGDSSEKIYDAIWQQAEAHAAGLPQRDDRTLVLIRRTTVQ